MFTKVSAAISDKLISKKIIGKSEKEVCAYGLRQIFSTVLNAGTMLLIGIFMRMTIEAIIFTFAYIPVRIYAGGFHASTPQRCWVVSSIMLFVALFTVKYMPEKYFAVSTALSLIACIVIFKLSSVEDKNKTLDEKEHRVYRRKAICILFAEIVLAAVLFILKCKTMTMLIGTVWCSLAVMLILGKMKNKYNDKHNKVASD